ncbi:hypothetical protein CONPUDRAFT_79513 [Coniophora puteana RWD-64-598 SS2]|uniref:Uncharacterized protein n=1 Tax=Coniophora puteana (strain RWD-64-598) TaxID=741705 RepID=A0A5M3MZW4_CONPW|nr:uncharacterized protein CONPUDRAFT_79513 [Coniophora puteana RWD-64-598 SS2]EIW84668.1 hypothetical protein CONPUDRAFT_79513 [Coniophora puteana RWD-64-598 SS2]
MTLLPIGQEKPTHPRQTQIPQTTPAQTTTLFPLVDHLDAVVDALGDRRTRLPPPPRQATSVPGPAGPSRAGSTDTCTSASQTSSAPSCTGSPRACSSPPRSSTWGST